MVLVSYAETADPSLSIGCRPSTNKQQKQGRKSSSLLVLRQWRTESWIRWVTKLRLRCVFFVRSSAVGSSIFVGDKGEPDSIRNDPDKNELSRDEEYLTSWSAEWGLCALRHGIQNGSHFGLPPCEIHRMTGLPPKIVRTMTYSHRPHWNGTLLLLCSLRVIDGTKNLQKWQLDYGQSLVP